MKILLYMPSHIEKRNANQALTSVLLRCLAQKAEISYASKWPSEWKTYDVIHVFGCSGRQGPRLIRKAKHERIPTVLSPLGDLQPWNSLGHGLGSTKPMRIRQRQMTIDASAVHLCSVWEQQHFEQLKWNPRTQLIQNTAITSMTSEAQMADSMLRLYQKAIDSNAYAQIGTMQRRAILLLLQAGIDAEKTDNPAYKAETDHIIPVLTQTDWRNICLYAYDEQILDLIQIGLKRIQFIAPNIVVEDIERFPSTYHYEKKHLESKALPDNLLKARTSRIIEEGEDTNVRELVTMVLHIRHEIRHHNMPLLHLADLYRKMKFTDYDEDEFYDMTVQLGIDTFTARLVSILEEELGLTEGFHPIEARQDKETKQLTKNIIKL
ncbi:MAG: hypothetical protein MSD82_06190 [Prevotella sp.]|nr:hypothetical protein [Prevotella sp.]